jgi:hypothetical protein
MPDFGAQLANILAGLVTQLDILAMLQAAAADIGLGQPGKGKNQDNDNAGDKKIALTQAVYAVIWLICNNFIVHLMTTFFFYQVTPRGLE